MVRRATTKAGVRSSGDEGRPKMVLTSEDLELLKQLKAVGAEAGGIGTMLGVPLVRESSPIGVPDASAPRPVAIHWQTN